MASRRRRAARRLQPGLLHAAAREPAGGKRWRVPQSSRLSPALPRVRGERHQAHVEPVDGTRGLLDQQPPRVLRRPGDGGAGPDAVHHLAEHRRRRLHDADLRQRQERDLPSAAEVSVHGQRRVSVPAPDQRRRQRGRTRRLRAAVLRYRRIGRSVAAREAGAARPIRTRTAFPAYSRSTCGPRRASRSAPRS